MAIIELDQQLFLFVNSFVGKSVIFDNLARLLVNEYFIPTLLSLIMFGLWFYWGNVNDKNLNQKSVVLAVLAIGLGSLIVVSVLNSFFERPRPFDVLDTNLLFYKPTDPSFPSNSAVVAFALAASIFVADRKLGFLALLTAAFYGFLRVFVGVHFPSDVLVGAIVGVLSVATINRFQNFLMKVVILLRHFLKAIKLEEFA